MLITQYNFSDDQYYQKEYEKTQIFLHHTAGNSDPVGVYKDWENNDYRIATAFVIGGKPYNGADWVDGEIISGYASKYWAYHLGLKQSLFTEMGLPYKSLDRISIGIEICNWGQLEYKDGKFYNWVNREVPESDVVELEFNHRDYLYYHAYTIPQLESLSELLIKLNSQYGIPIDYYDTIWDIDRTALEGKPGLYTHCSVRKDKTDCSPQPKLIEFLNSL